MQWLVLTRSVGHVETGFRLCSSVLATPIGKRPCSVLHCAVDDVVESGLLKWVVKNLEFSSPASNAMYEIIISDLYYLLLVVVVVFFLLIQWTGLSNLCRDAETTPRQREPLDAATDAETSTISDSIDRLLTLVWGVQKG